MNIDRLLKINYQIAPAALALFGYAVFILFIKETFFGEYFNINNSFSQSFLIACFGIFFPFVFLMQQRYSDLIKNRQELYKKIKTIKSINIICINDNISIDLLKSNLDICAEIELNGFSNKHIADAIYLYETREIRFQKISLGIAIFGLIFSILVIMYSIGWL